MTVLGYNTRMVGPTYTGRAVDLDRFREDDVDIEDIAHSLSMQCRYNGHTKQFYSVAEHSIHISNHLALCAYGPTVQLAGLLHDAHEAYVGDIIRPIVQDKMMLSFRRIRDAVQAVIESKFVIMLKPAERDAVDMLDKRIILDEKARLLHKAVIYDLGVRPLEVRFPLWNPAEAKVEFLARFAMLVKSPAEVAHAS